VTTFFAILDVLKRTDPNWVIALTTVILAYFTIKMAVDQSRANQEILVLDTLFKMIDEFNSPRMLEARRVASQFLSSSLPDREDSTSSSLDNVLDFFDTLSSFYKNNRIGKEETWNNFYYWVRRYNILAKNYVVFAQKVDPTLWDNNVYLDSQLIEIQKTELIKRKAVCDKSHQSIDIPEEELIWFTIEERDLVSRTY
jgi:hypothetical protein